MRNRLNAIQKSMLQWNQMHPYNAVHVVQVRGVLDPVNLRNSVNTTVTKHGLTRLRLDCARFTFQFDGCPADCEITTIPHLKGSLSTLHTEVERQLNWPFDHTQPFSLFRFFVAPEKDCFFLGVVYSTRWRMQSRWFGFCRTW